MLKVYGFAIFLSAALLFLIQPLAGKILLPLLGGSPAVWNTCMVFFQAVLLLGYLYAHLLTRYLRPPVQVTLHAAILVAVALTLPIPIDVGAPSGSPNIWLIKILAVTVGLPFFALSTSGPLLQKWFSRTTHAAAADPYFLYAASNAGSIIGLLAYPFLLEPLLTRQDQSWTFSGGYVLLIPAVGACAWLLLRNTRPADAPAPPGIIPDKPVTLRRRLKWIMLAIVPSSLMLGVTQHISTDVAAIPLLWIVPLLLYLLSFIVAFSQRVKLTANFWGRALPIATIPVMFTLLAYSRNPIILIVFLHLAAFFIAAVMCHKLLADDRPDPRHLTEFYLLMSVGGVVGGAFNALLAPVAFDSILEYPLMIGAALLMRPQLAQDMQRSETRPILSVIVACVLGALMFFVLIIMDGLIQTGAVLRSAPVQELLRLNPNLRTEVILVSLLAGFPLAFTTVLLLFRGSLRFAVVALSLLVASHFTGAGGPVAYQRRTFFGVHRVTYDAKQTWSTLSHGTTVHGVQARRKDDKPAMDALSRQPTTYYTRSGPIGDVIKHLTDAGRFQSAGFVGLGAGTMAAYAQPGMTVHFYEIDPAVIEIAGDPRLFTYISDAVQQPGVSIGRYEGDGRLGLKEAPESFYDLIVIDAFSSDAIPVHLVTLEAVAMYTQRLKPGGVIAFHISSRYFDLAPVLTRIAAKLNMTAIQRNDSFVSKQQREEGKKDSVWLAIARKPEDLGNLMHNTNWERLEPHPDAPLWTDDYSNLLKVFVGWN